MPWHEIWVWRRDAWLADAKAKHKYRADMLRCTFAGLKDLSEKGGNMGK